MTTMKRMSVLIPPEVDKAILEMKKTDEFVRCSYAELIRLILRRGLEKNEGEKG